MGSFMGHLLPGVFFLFFGMWYAVKTSYRHLTGHQSRKRCCNLEMIEACAKILCPAFGILMEQVTNNGPLFHLTNSNNQFWDGNNWSHCTMYFFFIFAGLADFLLMKFPKTTPQGVDHLALAIAVFVEGFLFYFHTHNKDMLEVRIHILLVIAIWSGSIALSMLWILEALYQKGTAFASNFTSGSEYIQLLDYGNTDEVTEFDKTDPTLEETVINEDAKCNGSTNASLSKETNYLQSLNGTLKNNDYYQRTRTLQSKTFKLTLQMLVSASFWLQGTWFIQIAAILYPPGRQGWDTTTHINVEFATTFFAWHLAVSLVFVTTVFYVVNCLLSKLCRHKVHTQI